jgi:hypothetical protein
MNARPAFLENSVIVAAHPDDELLWFNAILHEVDEVIVVYRDFWAQPGLGEKRAAALADFPRAGVSCLNIAESGAAGCANWDDPRESPDGLVLSFESQRRELTRMSRLALGKVGMGERRVAEHSVLTAYQNNFVKIQDLLRERLRPGMNVFTHNPWGEYGHEEHVQLFRVLQGLRDEIGFNLWMSNYCTNRSLPLAMRYFQTSPGQPIRLPTNKVFAEEVASVYKRHDCWTWADDWQWFDDEWYLPAPRQGATPQPHQHLFPLNLFTIDVAQKRPWFSMAVGSAAAASALMIAADF